MGTAQSPGQPPPPPACQPGNVGQWQGLQCLFLWPVLAYSGCPLGLVSLSHSVPRQLPGPSEKLRTMNDCHTPDLGSKLIVENASQSRVATHLQSQYLHSGGKGSRIIVCSRPAGSALNLPSRSRQNNSNNHTRIYRWPILHQNSFPQHIQS